MQCGDCLAFTQAGTCNHVARRLAVTKAEVREGPRTAAIAAAHAMHGFGRTRVPACCMPRSGCGTSLQTQPTGKKRLPHDVRHLYCVGTIAVSVTFALTVSIAIAIAVSSGCGAVEGSFADAAGDARTGHGQL